MRETVAAATCRLKLAVAYLVFGHLPDIRDARGTDLVSAARPEAMANGSQPDAALSADVFVTAPRGSADMEPLLAALRGQLGAADRLVILDGTVSGASLDGSALPGVGSVEHLRDAGESGFHLRCRVPENAQRDIVVVFEEHAVPSPRFMSEVRRLFADPAVIGVKLLGRNDTSTDPWSWANFFIAFADCLHPSDGAPKAMLSTSAAVRKATLDSAPRSLGAWDTQVMPGLNREPDALAYSNDVWIDHVDHCDMKVAVVGNFRNQRAMAAVRVANGHPRGKLAVRAFKDLALRRPGYIERALAGRAEYGHFAANRWKVVLVCWASALGAIAGAWFDAGAAMRKMH
jgi:hypothetical protein